MLTFNSLYADLLNKSDLIKNAVCLFFNRNLTH